MLSAVYKSVALFWCVYIPVNQKYPLLSFISNHVPLAFACSFQMAFNVLLGVIFFLFPSAD